MSNEYLQVKTPSGTYFATSEMDTNGGYKAVTDPSVLKGLTSGSIKAKQVDAPATNNIVNKPATISASFGSISDDTRDLVSKISSGYGSLDERLRTAYGDIETKKATEIAASDLRKSSIESTYDLASEEIKDIQTFGAREIERARGTLMQPSLIDQRKIDSFSDNVQKWTNNVSRSIERLVKEKENALANEDYTKFQNLSKIEQDYANMEYTMFNNQMNILTSMYNLSLTGRQQERQEKLDEQTQASNTLNTLLGAYQGSTLSSLSSDVKNKLVSAATTMGIPEESIDRLLRTSADIQVIHDTATGWTVGIDKNTGREVYRNLMPGRTGSYESSSAQGVIRELSSSISTFFLENAGQDKKVDVEDYAIALESWKQQAPTQLKTFFLNYPTSRYLNQSESDSQKKEVIDMIVKQESDVTNKSSNEMMDALLYNLMDNTTNR